MPSLKRLPYYYAVLTKLENSFQYISSSIIANELGLDDTQVRKDIAATGYLGKPKIGFETKSLKKHLNQYLKMNIKTSAILIGAGNLGSALIHHEAFKDYGLDIVSIFDVDREKIGRKLSGKEILRVEFLRDVIQKRNIEKVILSFQI